MRLGAADADNNDDGVLTHRVVFDRRQRNTGRQKEMLDPTPTSPVSIDPVGLLASEILKDLYAAVCGHEALAVRAYQDEDAMLLLLRFDPTEFEGGRFDAQTHLLETAVLAMPGMVASAVEARTGRRLAPGNLSVSADRGLAVFAFSALDEPSDLGADEDLFRIDAPAMSAAGSGRASLRLAS